jgi:cytidylyltransferase-like protein
MFPAQNEFDLIVRILHESPWKAVIACTGAGAGLQQLLWSVPDASKTVLDAVMPYDRFALADFIGREPEKYCSRDTALWMAAAAYRRAKELAIRGGVTAPVMGLGLTAAVATSAQKKGDHRAFIAVKTPDRYSTVSVTLTKGKFDRVGEGSVCDLVALNTMLAAAGLHQVYMPDCGLASEEIVVGTDAPDPFVVKPRVVEPLADHVTDVFDRPLFLPDGSRAGLDALDPDRHVLFWGSFRPLHHGHELMAAQTERMTGKKVLFAITGTHPEKGPIPESELLERAEQFRWSWPVLFTPDAALYVEKARKFPGLGMLIGADVALGILNPKYYGGPDGCNAALDELSRLDARFYVVGREIEGKFVTLDDLPIPAERRELFLPVSGRWDVRSRDLR